MKSNRPKRDKLAAIDAIRIRVRFRNGESQAELAKQYHVTPGTIHAAVHRKTHNLRLAEAIRRARFNTKRGSE